MMQSSKNLILNASRRWLATAFLTASCVLSVMTGHAGTFFSDFNSGLPLNSSVFGNSVIGATGGFTNSGCLKLTTPTSGGAAGFVITNDIDAGNPVVSFTASFKALVGGGSGADGFSFNFAPDVPLGTIDEEGTGTGLTVEFDTYPQTLGDFGIDVKSGGGEIATLAVQPSSLRQNTFVDVFIQLAPDGTLNVFYDGIYAHTNLNTGISSTTAGLFGLGARTGGSTDNHFVDNLNIVTRTNAVPLPTYYFPIGRSVRADSPMSIVLTDFGTSVDAASISMKLDGVTVTPVITQSAPTTTINYTNPALFASNSAHTVTVVFADNATPTPNTNTLAYNFTVAGYSALAANLAAPASYINLASPGLDIRYSQIDDTGSRDILRAELQLAGLIIDATTSLPEANLAAPNPSDSSFSYHETNVINYAFPSGGSVGDFAADTDIPGTPGPTTGNASDYAMDAVAYLHLAPGLYNLGVNSSDGFKLAVADSPDIFALQESIFSSVRAPADSTVSFSVAVDGYYPFRLVYFTGDPLYAPAPGTTTPTVEFFNIDRGGNKTLINDTNVLGYVPAFSAAKTKPYVRSVSPPPADSGVAGNTAITATLVDQSLRVLTNTIVLQVNGTTVAPTILSNSSVYTVTYQPPTVFLPNSSNFVSLAFTDTDANRRTNTWFFTVANIMTPIWSIAAANNTWVTAGSTERGLAYNPKTGHLILVSRAASPAPAAGLGIAILNSTNGAVLGTMNVGVAASGPGTFKLSMVDVADDGVIYMCNLSTSAAQNFRIYRFQDESSAPTLAYDAPPTAAAGTPRWGDDFRVRGSGAGTQIIAAGNNVSANSLPIFTTIDGTNFTATVIAPTGLAINSVRLGLAFGCGNTFYGETTSTPMSYVGFNGPPSAVANLIATYGIYDKNNGFAMGPIALDIPNQRLIANQTIAPHNINLYDVPTLVTTPTKNYPIDQRNYASQNTSFGTGSVDFSPDGLRLFSLDTGNGIIAFSMAAANTPIAICSQPQNFIAPLGRIGFFGVTATGSPQKYQWRYNGANITGATNGTLDTYYIAQGNLGFYSVVITNSFGSVTSSVAILDTPITITNQPASQIVAPGGTATFTVGATNGLPAYGYQWQFNGANIAGATSSTYTTNNVQVANAGAYTAVITDSLSQSVTSLVAVLTVGTAGTGTGLLGDYYSSQLMTLIDPPTLSRVDPTVNFDFVVGSPDPSISTDSFTTRWSGQVQPFYSQTYTFYTLSDDGVRLWVNNQLLVNKWVNQAATEWSGTVPLNANQKYNIVMEYFENTGNAVAKLSWSSPNQVKQIVPQSQLYVATGRLQPTATTSTTGGITTMTITWSGSYALYSSTDVNGPYNIVSGATSPYVVTVDKTATSMFFKLVSQ